MVITATTYLTLLPLVFLAAFVDAIAGGGGLISLPAYMITGMPSVLAAGTNKSSACVGTITAAVKFLRNGKVLLLPALIAAALAIPGAYLGAALLNHTPENVYRTIVLILVPLVALFTLLQRGGKDEGKPMNRARLIACGAIGLGCGIYDGFFGPGTGTILILALHGIVGMDTVTALGSAKIVNLASNITAVAVHVISGNVLYALAFPAMAMAMLGGYIGSSLAIRKGAKLIRVVMLVVMVLLLVKLAVDYL